MDEDWPEDFPAVEAFAGAALVLLGLEVESEEESEELVDFVSLESEDDEVADESLAAEPDRLSVR